MQPPGPQAAKGGKHPFETRRDPSRTPRLIPRPQFRTHQPRPRPRRPASRSRMVWFGFKSFRTGTAPLPPASYSERWTANLVGTAAAVSSCTCGLQCGASQGLQTQNSCAHQHHCLASLPSISSQYYLYSYILDSMGSAARERNVADFSAFYDNRKATQRKGSDSE